MESCGFRVLKNESLLLEEYQLQLLGYDDYLTGELGGQLPAFAEGVFPLLVAHEPYTAQLLSGIPERALMLSGHTHGGQVGIPGSPAGFCRQAPVALYADCMHWMTRSIPLRFM